MNFIITYTDYNHQYTKSIMFGDWSTIANFFSQQKGIPIDFIISIEKEPLS